MRHRFHILLAAMLATAFAVAASAEDVDGIRVVQTEPLAPRGRTMMLRLDAEHHGTDWPLSIDVHPERGRAIRGDVIWIEGRPAARDIHWTASPIEYSIRRIEPTDDSSAGQGAPFLLVELPAEGAGVLRVLGQSLRPIWVDVPQDPLGEDGGLNFIAAIPGERTSIVLERAHDRPDPASPFDYWRWVLLASRLGQPAPEPSGDELTQRVAQYQADLWTIGLSRLARSSPGVARECRDLLTSVSIDNDTPFASWVTDASRIEYLLGILLDFRKSETDVVEEALNWADSQDRLFFWFEGDEAGRIKLAFVNSGREKELGRFRWSRPEVARAAEGVPIAVELPPHRLTHVILDRPMNPEERADDETRSGEPRLPGQQPSARPSLVLEVGRFSQSFEVRPAQVEVTPPGLFFSPFHTTMTLAAARAGASQAPPLPFSTNAAVRRMNGRWEIFFECFRPGGFRGSGEGGTPPLMELDSIFDTVGLEAITLTLQSATDEEIALTVPESGWWRTWSGRRDDTMQIHRRSYEDRWYCRIVLPDSWIQYPLFGSLRIGFMRTHGDNSSIETSPSPLLPWQKRLEQAQIGLHSWQDLPQ